MTLLERPPAQTHREPGTCVLKTARLVLRAPRPEDAKALATLINDRRIAENLARVPYPYRLADAKEFIARANNGGVETSFLITLPDDTIVGGCGVGKLFGTDPEIGYWLGVPHWGKGYATETARALIDHAFTELGHDRLEAGARVSNPTSRRVLEKCGFQWTGVMLLRVRALNSAAPADRFRLDRGLWASLRSWGGVKALA
jgi:RimJ/RimL family protein N-acetyltransferase